MGNRTVSIIIPFYNELSCVDALIKNLRALKGEYEIIFVDGGSSDGTAEIIKQHHTVLQSPQKGRAYQMNYGAKKARGGILLFLHADCLLNENAIEEIHRVMDNGYLAGCFRIKFDSKDLLMKICAFFSTARVKFRNISFGDQGIFIDKYYFHKLGGYKEIPLMEDYQLSIDIKRNGQKIGLANAVIVTSRRRFLAGGRLKTMMLMQKLQYMYRKGIDIQLIAKLYKERDSKHG